MNENCLSQGPPWRTRSRDRVDQRSLYVRKSRERVRQGGPYENSGGASGSAGALSVKGVTSGGCSVCEGDVSTSSSSFPASGGAIGSAANGDFPFARRRDFFPLFN